MELSTYIKMERSKKKRGKVKNLVPLNNKVAIIRNQPHLPRLQ
jgi:hypothetical protein